MNKKNLQKIYEILDNSLKIIVKLSQITLIIGLFYWLKERDLLPKPLLLFKKDQQISGVEPKYRKIEDYNLPFDIIYEEKDKTSIKIPTKVVTVGSITAPVIKMAKDWAFKKQITELDGNQENFEYNFNDKKLVDSILEENGYKLNKFN